ncbi:hypothetical protein [Streptomyces lavendofoliae]|nr:hypothetical protein [Streptomyces lavendofoliae]
MDPTSTSIPATPHVPTPTVSRPVPADPAPGTTAHATARPAPGTTPGPPPGVTVPPDRSATPSSGAGAGA